MRAHRQLTCGSPPAPVASEEVEAAHVDPRVEEVTGKSMPSQMGMHGLPHLGAHAGLVTEDVDRLAREGGGGAFRGRFFDKDDLASLLVAYCGISHNPQPPGGKRCFAKPLSTLGDRQS